MMTLLTQTIEATTLVKLAFAYYVQNDQSTVKELQILYKFKNIANLNLSSSSNSSLKFEFKQ